jgi:hypothetical protein
MKKTLLSLISFLIVSSSLFSQVTVTISANGSTTICTGNSVQLTGTVSPTGVYQYQWQRNGTNITGANTNDLSVNTSGNYVLKVTDLNSTIYNSNTINVTVNSLPSAPSVTYNSPAIICNGGSVLMSDNSSTNVSYSWFLNNVAISNATSNAYTATSAGTYKLEVTNLTTGCKNFSQNIVVGEMPNIVQNEIVTCGSSTTISLTNPNFSYSTLPASCSVDMSNGNVVNTNIGGNGGGGETTIICFGGRLTNEGGLNTFVVEYGGTFDFNAGSGANTVYVKAGGICNVTDPGGGDNIIYYEQGAIISPLGLVNSVLCSKIGVIYPSNSTALCNNLTYQWSNGATTPTITVNPTIPTTYSVTVSNGSLSCTDQVLVTPTGVAPTISASGPTTFCQGDSVVLTSSSATENTWSNGATTQSITVTSNGNYSVTVSNGSCSSVPIAVNVNPIPTVTLTALGSFTNIYSNSISLNGSPSGGVYSGNGVNGSDFQPQIAGLGNATVNYSFTNSFGCSGSASQSTIVFDTTRIICSYYDTVTIYDTLLTTVTDTLVINTTLNLASPNNENKIKIYPNPTSDYITIDNGNFAAMTGYSIKITNNVGQQVFQNVINQAQFKIDLSTWSGNGLYFVHLIDPQSNTVTIRKIILQ